MNAAERLDRIQRVADFDYWIDIMKRLFRYYQAIGRYNEWQVQQVERSIDELAGLRSACIAGTWTPQERLQPERAHDREERMARLEADIALLEAWEIEQGFQPRAP